MVEISVICFTELEYSNGISCIQFDGCCGGIMMVLVWTVGTIVFFSCCKFYFFTYESI